MKKQYNCHHFVPQIDNCVGSNVVKWRVWTAERQCYPHSSKSKTFLLPDGKLRGVLLKTGESEDPKAVSSSRSAQICETATCSFSFAVHGLFTQKPRIPTFHPIISVLSVPLITFQTSRSSLTSVI